MKSLLTTVALCALGLTAITACTIETGSADGVSRQFGSDFFGVGGVLNIVDPIQGDAFLAGGNVSVASQVDGDLMAAGGDVSIGGGIGDDLLVAGGNVSIDAIVDGDARIAGGDVTVGVATTIDGSTTLAGGSVEFDGVTSGPLHASGARVHLNGSVDGDATVRAEDFTIGPDTRVSGKLVYSGPSAPMVPEGAVIAGGLEHHEESIGSRIGDARDEVRNVTHVAGNVAWFLGTFLVAGLFLLAFPSASVRVTDILGREPLKAMGLGFLVIVCLPMVALVLVLTIIGIPLALLLVPIAVLLFSLGWITTALFLARKGLERWRGTTAVTAGWNYVALFAALGLLWVLKRLPIVGGWIAFIALIAGTGAFVWQIWSRRDAATPAAT